MKFDSPYKIPVIYGRRPKNYEKEFSELMVYDSGQADIDASQVSGPFKEPWLNVISACEPASMPAFEQILKMQYLQDKIHGNVLDLGAGTCWLTAKVSLLLRVNQVFSLDLSEKFMFSSGIRILKHFNARFDKITFVVSDFNDIPLEDSSVDCILLFGAIHHSLSPIKTLQECSRCLKKGGVIMILENPISSIRIWVGRKSALELSKNISEIAYTMRELEYMIKIAGIGKVQRIAFDILSRSGIKMVARKICRYLDVEDLLLRPPTYLFIIEKS